MNKWFIRIPLILLGLLLALLLLAFAAFRIINPTNGKLVSAGEERRYLLYVPESYDPIRPHAAGHHHCTVSPNGLPTRRGLAAGTSWQTNTALSWFTRLGRASRCAGARLALPAAPPIRCRMSRLSRT